MIFQQILNKDSGLSARAKLNTMLSALIESEEGVNAAWVLLRSLENYTQNLSNRESNDVAVLEERISGANDYTDRSINKLYTYVDGMEGGVGGLIDSPSFDPSNFPADKAITLIALGAGTFTNLHDVTDTPITVSQSNSITVFYRAAYVTYWNYKTQVLQAPPMDLIPTAGNTDHVVSSAGIHQFVLAHGFNDDIDIVDITDSSLKAQCIIYAMRKNHGTEEDPNYETIATFIIPIASLMQAGLLPPYINGVFDVNIFSNTAASFSSLEAVLANADTLIPVATRRSGMPIQFKNDDGDMERWTFMLPYANTPSSNANFVSANYWRGVDLIPRRGSHNFVESQGIFDFSNRVIFVAHWGSYLAGDPLPEAQQGQHLYNTRTNQLFWAKPDFEEGEEEEAYVWDLTTPIQADTLYIKGDTYVAYVWNNGHMEPVTKFAKVFEMTSSQVSVALAPNVLYRWGELTELTITAFTYEENNFVNEYMMEFTVDGDEFTLTLPEGVRWATEPTWENGYTYQISVIDDLAVCAGWEAPEEDEPL